jgi:hypothetical protein
VLDVPGFMEEKILEAMDNEPRGSPSSGRLLVPSPCCATGYARNELVQANFILVLGNMIGERWTSEWWDDFSKTEQGEFERTARDLVGRLAILRTLVREVSASQTGRPNPVALLRSTPERPPWDRIDSAVSIFGEKS